MGDIWPTGRGTAPVLPGVDRSRTPTGELLQFRVRHHKVYSHWCAHSDVSLCSRRIAGGHAGSPTYGVYNASWSAEYKFLLQASCGRDNLAVIEPCSVSSLASIAVLPAAEPQEVSAEKTEPKEARGQACWPRKTIARIPSGKVAVRQADENEHS